MLHQVFSVHDSKADFYMTPIFFKTKGEALRAFSAIVNDASHHFNKYPEDFTMFHLGSYDDDKAKFELHLTPIPLGKALEFINVKVA